MAQMKIDLKEVFMVMSDHEQQRLVERNIKSRKVAQVIMSVLPEIYKIGFGKTIGIHFEGTDKGIVIATKRSADFSKKMDIIVVTALDKEKQDKVYFNDVNIVLQSLVA
jgi:hypothetical protein